jgi:hypothetical protein
MIRHLQLIGIVDEEVGPYNPLSDKSAADHSAEGEVSTFMVLVREYTTWFVCRWL